MPFAQRDDRQKIVGLFANLQPGFAEEWLEDDAEEIAEFNDSHALKSEPSWGAFRMGMIADMGYLRYATAAISASPVFFQQLQIAIAMADPFIPAIVQLWGIVLSSVAEEDRPTESEIESWNAIAADANLTIRFDNQGLLA